MEKIGRLETYVKEHAMETEESIETAGSRETLEGIETEGSRETLEGIETEGSREQ